MVDTMKEHLAVRYNMYNIRIYIILLFSLFLALTQPLIFSLYDEPHASYMTFVVALKNT